MIRNKYWWFFPRLLVAAALLGSTIGWVSGVFAEPIAPQAGEQTYTVRSSDTLGSIARAHRVTVVSILAANPSITNPNHIHDGEQLLIPAPNLRPGQSIWDGYTGRVPVTGSSARSAPAPTTPPPASAPSHAATLPGPASGSGAIQPSGVPGNWKVIFDDEFTGNRLDTARWNTAFPWGGTSTTTPQLLYQPQNVSVGGGDLQLTAQNQASQGFPYTSGIVTTSGKFSYRYGLVEIRARVPAGQGLWPAFWSLPTSGASMPEIDVMEIMGGQPSITHLHYHDSSGNDVGIEYYGTNFSAGWHTYAVDWEPNAITWYVDGVRQNQFTDQAAIAAQPMYLIANLQVGGWPGAPDSSTPFPATYAIDYVRVWQR